MINTYVLNLIGQIIYSINRLMQLSTCFSWLGGTILFVLTFRVLKPILFKHDN